MSTVNLIFLIIGTAFMVGNFIFWKYAYTVPRFLKMIVMQLAMFVSLYYFAAGLGVFK